MKRVIQYILIVILFSVWGIILTNKESFRESFQSVKRQYIDRPCSEPVQYALGEVDPRFGVSREDLLKYAEEAEYVWEKDFGKNLFKYNPGAEFKINLVFDERQLGTIEADKLEGELGKLEASHNAISKQYDSLSGAYKKRANDYEKDVADYKKELDEYNDDVEYWNKKGGAPEDEYDKLKKKKKELDEEYKNLEKERKALNDLVEKTNNLATKEQQIVNNYNNNLNSYENKFGETREFEKGVFDGLSINIYQFKEAADLRLTLVHEMGHALGMGHAENPESIMYYLMGDQEMENPALTKEDVDALNKICNL
ncbi:MAG: Peptidase protein [Patescibacteria group bacterium]|nr:Peptidase protein [Patescibacteria group bacterium]